MNVKNTNFPVYLDDLKEKFSSGGKKQALKRTGTVIRTLTKEMCVSIKRIGRYGHKLQRIVEEETKE